MTGIKQKKHGWFFCCGACPFAGGSEGKPKARHHLVGDVPFRWVWHVLATHRGCPWVSLSKPQKEGHYPGPSLNKRHTQVVKGDDETRTGLCHLHSSEKRLHSTGEYTPRGKPQISGGPEGTMSDPVMVRSIPTPDHTNDPRRCSPRHLGQNRSIRHACIVHVRCSHLTPRVA